jgi:hypothetical protein
MPFFLEYNTGTEPLNTLVNKLDGYRTLLDQLGRAWPILFWLHSSARERNLRIRLADLPARVPIVTGARDLGLSPAAEVWTTAGTSGSRVALAEFTLG